MPGRSVGVDSPGDRSRALPGRPFVSSHAQIEQAAFELFDTRGFSRTTVAAIAERAQIGKRTFFRYFESKNDVPWGRFADSLTSFHRILREAPEGMSLPEAVHRGVLQFNDFGEEAMQQHRRRMGLILTTPELQAHSVLRFADWRAVIAEYVAERTGADPGALLPQVAGRVSLGLALGAYDAWLADPASSLPDLLNDSLKELRRYLAHDAS